MTVAELKEKLSYFDDDEQILFYYLKDNILTNALLEDINSYGGYWEILEDERFD